MATVSGSTSYSASSSRGLSGLVSGMDTQSMVDKMLSGTQAKINKQNANKQVLVWKQQQYRDVISTLRTFQQNFLSFQKDQSNLLSTDFFNTMTATSTSDAFKVIAGSNATSGTTTVDYIKQLATSTSYSSQSAASAELSGNLDLSKLDKNITLRIDGNTINIDLNGTNTEQEVLDTINAALGDKATASVTNGKFAITAANEKDRIEVLNGSQLGLSMLGLKAGQYANGKVAGNFSLQAGQPSIDITLDGVKKTIVLDPTAADPIAKLQESITNAFGNGIKVVESGGKVTFTAVKADGVTPDSNRQITIRGSAAGLEALGIKDGQSNKVTLGLALKDLSLDTPLAGNSFKFSINGVSFNFSAETSLNTVINTVNSSAAGVKIAYSTAEDKFTITSKSSGAGVKIDMQQESGNLLTSLFGVGSSASVAGKNMLETGKVTGGFISQLPPDATNFSITVDGTTYTVDIPENSAKDADGNPLPYETARVLELINTGLKEQNAGVSMAMSNGKIVVNTNGKDVSVPAPAGSLAETFGFTDGASNILADKTLADFGLSSGVVNIGGASVNLADLGPGASMQDLADALQNAIRSQAGNDAATVTVNPKTGALTIEGVEAALSFSGDDAAGSAALKKLFGASTFTLSGADTSSEVEGQNAILSINGVETERSSNNVSFDGLTIEISKVTWDGTGTPPAGESITTTRDTEKIYKGIMGFVDEYNKMIEKMESLVTSDPTYKKYPPLTPEQKKEMTESEIKLWEENAQKGLLRSDSTINDLLSEMRGALYGSVPGIDMALYTIGIETGDYKSGGKLNVDEATLRAAIETRGDEIEKLFTDDTNGVAVRMNKIIDHAAKSSSVSNGTLVELAGLPGVPDTSSSIYKQMKDIDDILTNLKRTYEAEKTRYWNQFNNMEKMRASMNQQSSWLMSQFS